ncbi:ParB N-terminal domain-containing protein [Cloacibacillus porcorum]|uniref:ParB N-terminal domain-containing protein n=1 Tax=Cloacibacillus porcorum TaxID=1197717 RepID=UPI002672BE28|nr:ParB N-terminal domain-containing protein [Cloacibacillus porcorum]
MKINEIVKRYYPRELLSSEGASVLDGESVRALLRRFVDEANGDLDRLGDERRLYLLEDIQIDEPRFQSRNDISGEAVETYAQSYENGADMPPVDIALLDDGRLYLIDGFHRCRARMRMGAAWGFIDAVLHKNLSEADARFFFIKENMKNGLPLRSRRDREKAFAIYVETGRCRYPNGMLKSYREIAEELTFLGKDTARRYMSSLFPEIARQLSNRYGEPEAGPLEDSSSKTELPEKSTAPALLKSLKRTGERAAAIATDESALLYERQLLALLNASRARWRRGVIETADYEGISGED